MEKKTIKQVQFNQSIHLVKLNKWPIHQLTIKQELVGLGLAVLMAGYSFYSWSHTRCMNLSGTQEISCGYHAHYPDIYPSYPLYEYRVDFSGKNKVIRKHINQIVTQAMHGNVRSQSLLSNYYKKGFGVRHSLVKAYAWLRVASNKGYRTAQYKLEKITPELSPETIEKGEIEAENLMAAIQHRLEYLNERLFDPIDFSKP